MSFLYSFIYFKCLYFKYDCHRCQHQVLAVVSVFLLLLLLLLPPLLLLLLLLLPLLLLLLLPPLLLLLLLPPLLLLLLPPLLFLPFFLCVSIFFNGLHKYIRHDFVFCF